MDSNCLEMRKGAWIAELLHKMEHMFKKCILNELRNNKNRSDSYQVRCPTPVHLARSEAASLVLLRGAEMNRRMRR